MGTSPLRTRSSPPPPPTLHRSSDPNPRSRRHGYQKRPHIYCPPSNPTHTRAQSPPTLRTFTRPPPSPILPLLLPKTNGNHHTSHSHLRILPPNRRTRPRGGPSLPPIRPGIRHSPTIPPIPSHTATILHNTHTRRHHPHCPAIPSYSEPPTAPNLAKRARPSYHTPPVRHPTTRNHPPRHLSMRARHRKNPPTTTSPPPFAPMQPPNSNALVSHRNVDHNLSHHSRRHPHHDSRLPSTGPHPCPEQIR